MGGGAWTTRSYTTYSTSRGRSLDSDGYVTTSYDSAQDMFTLRRISDRMNPKEFKVRECRDSEEHPNTLPVILAIDVTGSMGDTAMAVAKSLNGIVTEITKEVKDAEFCVMAIGDTYCDSAPVQMSQFESDVRIAQAFDDIYFEGGGGSNPWESYTAAWYMALHHTDLDVWKRGGKGVLITLGDEVINPVLEHKEIMRFILPDGVKVNNSHIPAEELYNEVSKKYDVYHIHVDHRSEKAKELALKSFGKVLPQGHVLACKVDEVPETVSKIVVGCSSSVSSPVEGATKVDENGMIDW